jgi:hypothetical protein
VVVDDHPPSNPPDDVGSMRSPIRPTRPEQPEFAPKAPPIPNTPPQMPPSAPTATNPVQMMEVLRKKMEQVASDFATGKINRAQFNAVYSRYSDQRSIIERLLQRNPENDAWRQVAAPGHTSFLMNHFEARAVYYLVFLHQQPKPLIWGGKNRPEGTAIMGALKTLWGMPNRPKTGVARKDIGGGQWLVLALGEFAVTIVMFSLEPSTIQCNLVRDMHADFERANRMLLERGVTSPERLVFPQRALMEKGF